MTLKEKKRNSHDIRVLWQYHESMTKQSFHLMDYPLGFPKQAWKCFLVIFFNSWAICINNCDNINKDEPILDLIKDKIL